MAAKPSTLGELRSTGYKVVPVKEELRRNLILSNPLPNHVRCFTSWGKFISSRGIPQTSFQPALRSAFEILLAPIWTELSES